ncbi:MAG: hypothetical protein LBV00_11135 [Propionibacteriaceae bacterium]|nr:hypothetical protein [Propionibacteriaceae bacterium]
MQSLYLRITASGGAEGFYGPIDPETTWVINEMLKPAIIGQDAFSPTMIWDRLDRLDRHARHGHFKMGVSAIDNALWDLKGRVLGLPVWQLLGGSIQRAKIPAYVSTLGTPLDRETVQDFAKHLADEGFQGQKWFPAAGPWDGVAGLERNVDLIEWVRQAVGPYHDIMVDAFHSWDLAFATAWVRRVEHLRPTWLEEPVSQSQYPAFRELARRTSIPLTGGEHLYERAELKQYLDDGVMSVVQADPEWCGGITELTRIAALADTYGVPSIPHGHGLHSAIHLIASQSAAVCPKVEYLIQVMPERHNFELNPPTPVNGFFDLPDEPGFGIDLDESKIDSRFILKHGGI